MRQLNFIYYRSCFRQPQPLWMRTVTSVFLPFATLLSVLLHPSLAQLPTFSEISRSGIALSPYRSRFGKYDRDPADGVITSREIRKLFEYATTQELDQYWSECDTDANGRLTFEEWVPCAGAYSDNGERFLETEWDDLVQEGILNLDRSSGSSTGSSRSTEF